MLLYHLCCFGHRERPTATGRLDSRPFPFSKADGQIQFFTCTVGDEEIVQEAEEAEAEAAQLSENNDEDQEIRH